MNPRGVEVAGAPFEFATGEAGGSEPKVGSIHAVKIKTIATGRPRQCQSRLINGPFPRKTCLTDSTSRDNTQGGSHQSAQLAGREKVVRWPVKSPQKCNHNAGKRNQDTFPGAWLIEVC